MIEAVDCCNPDHWFDSRVGWPGRHDGGLPDYPETPCVPFTDNGDPYPDIVPYDDEDEADR